MAVRKSVRVGWGPLDPSPPDARVAPELRGWLRYLRGVSSTAVRSSDWYPFRDPGERSIYQLENTALEYRNPERDPVGVSGRVPRGAGGHSAGSLAQPVGESDGDHMGSFRLARESWSTSRSWRARAGWRPRGRGAGLAAR